MKRRALSPVKRVAVVLRDGGRCQVCWEPIAPGDLEIDHIVPVARGGGDELENLRATHVRCNQDRKYEELANWNPYLGWSFPEDDHFEPEEVCESIASAFAERRIDEAPWMPPRAPERPLDVAFIDRVLP